MNSYPSFNDLANKITDKKQFHEIVLRQQKFFQINPYKIEKIYAETVKKIYALILAKYQITKQFQLLQNAWHENQRRVFVWYMIVLIDLNQINAQKTNQIRWDDLRNIFFGKSSQFLEFQFANILKTRRKITWNQEQDKILLEAMSKEKLGKWNQVSKRIFYESDCRLFKSPKHCRQRWYNHLDQSKNKGSWTLQQDYTIFKYILEHGKRWACVVKLLSNTRTEHMIKNRYNSLIAKLKKNKKKREQEMAELVYRNLEAQVKVLKRERKLKMQQLLSHQKKSQIVQEPKIIQEQKTMQKPVQKQIISEEQKSDHTTLKNGQVKIEQEVKMEQDGSTQKMIISRPQNENICYGNNIFNYYNFGQQMMQMQRFPLLYYCHPSAFVPVNTLCKQENMIKIENE